MFRSMKEKFQNYFFSSPIRYIYAPNKDEELKRALEIKQNHREILELEAKAALSQAGLDKTASALEECMLSNMLSNPSECDEKCTDFYRANTHNRQFTDALVSQRLNQNQLMQTMLEDAKKDQEQLQVEQIKQFAQKSNELMATLQQTVPANKSCNGVSNFDAFVEDYNKCAQLAVPCDKPLQDLDQFGKDYALELIKQANDIQQVVARAQRIESERTESLNTLANKSQEIATLAEQEAKINRHNAIANRKIFRDRAIIYSNVFDTFKLNGKTDPDFEQEITLSLQNMAKYDEMLKKPAKPQRPQL